VQLEHISIALGLRPELPKATGSGDCRRRV